MCIYDILIYTIYDILIYLCDLCVYIYVCVCIYIYIYITVKLQATLNTAHVFVLDLFCRNTVQDAVVILLYSCV